MASDFTPPVLNWNASDLPDEFQNFQEYCTLIFDGPFTEKAEKEKVAYLLLWIGRPGVNIYKSFAWDEESDKQRLVKVWKKFEKHLQPKVNYRIARFQLQQYRQRKDESTDDFIARC